jgi:GTP-binding protein HflX
MIETKTKIERGILVGLILQNQKEETLNEYLNELSFLFNTAGGEEVGRIYQKTSYPNPQTYLGKGKILDLKKLIQEKNADVAIFDDELSPSQIRNIEQTLKVKVLDRTSLILDIFAKNAKTAHAKIQVELAQCEYMLPRLAGLWTHLERQRGGIGMRGPGEREIETDRRILRNRISTLKTKLEKIDKQKRTQRSNRDNTFRISLVGYTNVGKSTLLNLLSGADVYVENKLFATLDTTIRKVVFNNKPFLFADTVGFIRKLPTLLVESFNSTLDEIRESDLLLHVVDASHPDFIQQIQTVSKTLHDIGVGDKIVIYVFNKIDLLTDEQLNNLQNSWVIKEYSPFFAVTAKDKDSVTDLRIIN